MTTALGRAALALCLAMAACTPEPAYAAPRWVIIENVPVLRTRGLDRVLGGLDALGFDADWDCVPASAIGARHRRDRLWLVAYPRRSGLPASECQAVFGPGWREEGRAAAERSGWASEPGVGRVVHGLSGRVDRIKALGNAVVPQIPELIGRAIMARAQQEEPAWTE